MRPKID